MLMRRLSRIAVGGMTLAALSAATTGSALGHGQAAPEPTVSAWLATWSFDPLPLLATLGAAAAYLIAVRRVERANPRVPVPRWRIAAWLGGLAVVFVALASAVDLYADDLLSVHMVQHLMLAMLAPPLLALGAPITLLLRVATPSARHRYILPVLHSRFVCFVAAPPVAWGTFTAVLLVAHFSPLYDAALEDPTLHVAEHLLFLAAGFLFWMPIVGADPSPWRLGYGSRLVYMGLQMPVSAAVGLAIYFAPAVLYAHYATMSRPWGPDPYTDQQIGGVVMWGAGDFVLLAVIPLIVAAWMRADARRSRRIDARLALAADQRK
jgi:putative membrane protein